MNPFQPPPPVEKPPVTVRRPNVDVCPGVRFVWRQLVGNDLTDCVLELHDAMRGDFPEKLTIPLHWRDGMVKADEPYAQLADGLLIFRCASMSAVYRQTVGHPDDFTRIA